MEEIGCALHAHINGCIEQFSARYQSWLTYPITLDPANAIRSFQSLLAAVNGTPHKLYLLIDEYDNFANEVLMSSAREGSDRYKALLYGEGLLKTVFKAVKGAGSGMGLDRAFTTGVAPVVLSDLSSGYNVARDVSFKRGLEALGGFNAAEIHALLQQVAAECDLSSEALTAAQETMRTFYNGYVFSEEATDWVYNPTLALYFLQNLAERNAARLREIRAWVWEALATPQEAPAVLRAVAARYGVTFAAPQFFLLALTTIHAALTSLQATGEATVIMENNRMVWRR